MHFALPPRKSSHPPPYARSSKSSPARRKQIQLGALVACAALALIYLATRIFSSSPDRVPPGTPETVIVTLIDPEYMSKDYVSRIMENRINYADRHGYATVFPKAGEYELAGSPRSWALVPSLRHAMTLYPHSTYFFVLSPHALIMNPGLSLNSHFMAPKRLESLMLKDKPVVPPDSVIKTFSHLKGDKVDLVLTQDGEGLCQGSFILRQGDWARFFLDTWFDPLYRSYNFQKAEGHALEHVVQWHPTILTKLALIEQRLLNSYSIDIASRGGKGAMYQENDFIVRLVGCELDSQRNCEKEMDPFYQQWKKAVAGSK
ncbi:hypothetical protein MMC22_007927 [Lobaria immixta]|nr:hypothetical protein [Lobaria immixta]